MADKSGKIELTQWLSDTHLVTGVIAAFVTAFIISTRLLTAFQSYQKEEEQKKGFRPPRVPYWLPFLGSLPSVWLRGHSFLSQAKEQFPNGMFAVKVGSTTKTYIYSRFLRRDLLSNNADKLDSTESHLRLLQSGFGVPFRFSTTFLGLWPKIEEELVAMEKSFGKQLEQDAIKNIERQLPDLITFSTSPIDQHQWERTSGTILLDDKETVETGLFALIQTFFTHFTTSQLLSPALLEQTPDLAPLLLTVPSELNNLLHRPSFLSPRAIAVQRTLLTHFSPFLDAVYASEEEQATMTAYDDVALTKSPFIALLQSPALKAAKGFQSSVLAYLLTLSVMPHLIVPWALIELNTRFSASRNKFAAGVREVVASGVSVVQEAGIGAFRPPPVIKISEKARRSEAVNGLIAETTVAYARGWAEYDVKADITIKPLLDSQEGATSVEEIAPERWHLREGDTVVVVNWLAEEEPEDWQADGTQVANAVKAALQRLGYFHLPVLASYLTAVYTSFLLSFLKLYDIETTDADGWSIPEANFAPGIALPKKDIRVRIRSREYDIKSEELPMESKDAPQE